MTFSESTAEDGAVTYRYASLSSGQEPMSEYVETLTAGYDCHVLQEDGAIIPDPDLSAESGEADLGISSAGGGGDLPAPAAVGAGQLLRDPGF